MSEHVNLELGDNGGEASKKYSRVKSREMAEKKEETSLSKEGSLKLYIVNKNLKEIFTKTNQKVYNL